MNHPMNPFSRPKIKLGGANKSRLNRRAFLRGAGTVAIGLPFLEGLPERSAWAQNENPIFSFFIVSAHGVVHDRFWSEEGPITQASLEASENAVKALAPHAANLTFLQGVNFPMRSPTNCGHAQGLCMALTARSAQGGGRDAQSTGLSADVFISDAVNASGVDALALYAGNKRNGYIVERLSFNGGGAGQVRSAADNPYGLYQSLTGLVQEPGATTGGTDGDPSVADELVLTRKSVNDLVRDELELLMARPELSAEDHARLEQHFEAIRDTENQMQALGEACSMEGINTSALDAMKTGFQFNTNGMIEEVVELHMQLVAVAFACGFNRSVSLQWGDGTDQTRYDVPSNASLNWPFHHVSHRAPSDGSSGTNPTAEAAHAEIDALRMETLARGLDHFAARGLEDKAFVYWSSHVSDGPTHSFQNLPIIIWGNAGGYLKTSGQHLTVEAGMNNMMNTLITAATGTAVDDFGEGDPGPIAALIS